MVYLGPIEPRRAAPANPAKPAQVNALVASVPAHPLQEGEDVPLYERPGFVERRKQDRRQARKSSLVETRVGRDRRQSPRGSVDVSV